MDVDLKPYKIVNNGAFVYNPSRLDLGSIAYRTQGLCIVSHLYIVFYLNDEGKEKIDPEWLFMYFRRDEFYREVSFRNFGSQRPEFNFNDMSDIMLPLPDISEQRKYVAIYKAMVANQQCYERGLEDLKLVCDGYIEDLCRKMTSVRIGKYIMRGEKNREERIENVLGIGQSGFIAPQKKPNESLKNYKIISKGVIVYAPPLYNMLTGAVHYYDGELPAVCSPIYEVFRCKGELRADYLILWLKREEFKRYAEYFSSGVRGTFDYELMEEVKISIPDIRIQKAIADMYRVYTERKRINEQLKSQIKNICPILIRGSLEKGK